MQVTLQTEKIGPKTYITGYYSSSDGESVPAGLEGVTEWRDEFGNPLWELLEGGKVIPANLTPTTDQASKYEKKQLEAKVSGAFVEIVAEAIRSTNDANQSWAAIDAALRDTLK